jgi:hypothetical protein
MVPLEKSCIVERVCVCGVPLPNPKPYFAAITQSGMSDDKLVHTKIRKALEGAFWLSLADDLSAPTPSYTRVLSVLIEISNGVQVIFILTPPCQIHSSPVLFI